MKKFKYWIAYNCLRILCTVFLLVFALLEMVDVLKFPWKERSETLIYMFFLSLGLYVGGLLNLEAIKYLRKNHDDSNSESNNPLKKVE